MTLSRRKLLQAAVATAVATAGSNASAAPGYRVLATGLRFPESPVPLQDGSVLVVEIERGTLTRISPSGSTEVVAQLNGGPNGAAIGPDGACYVVNNGGFAWRRDASGLLFPDGSAADYKGGRVERVDLRTGRSTTLYTQCNGIPLSAPNDLVFDRNGGFYFTDNGRNLPRSKEHGGLYYALADGSSIREVLYPLENPNGVALSPDGKTVYVALTTWRMILALPVAAPGEVVRGVDLVPGRVVASLGGLYLLDSMAVDEHGNVNVATIVNGGILSLTPEGKEVRRTTTPDPLTTSIRFGGSDRRTAFITLGASGRLISMPWSVAGLALNYVDYG